MQRYSLTDIPRLIQISLQVPQGVSELSDVIVLKDPQPRLTRLDALFRSSWVEIGVHA